MEYPFNLVLQVMPQLLSSRSPLEKDVPGATVPADERETSLGRWVSGWWIMPLFLVGFVFLCFVLHCVFSQF